MTCAYLHLKIKLKWKILTGALFAISFLFATFTAIQAKPAIVHANVVWEMADIVAQEGR